MSKTFRRKLSSSLFKFI
uniref:Uncharacterized protein n=1 Tax=Megaselia scalaris TaxID=36166 RepID=T1GZG1_MEGSC